MTFYFFQVLLELKYSLLLIFHYYLFTVVTEKGDNKMASQSLVVKNELNTNSDCLDKSDSFQIKNLFSEEFLKYLHDADKTEGIVKHDNFKGEPIYSMQNTSNSDSNNSFLKGVNEFEYGRNKNWATWKSQRTISTARLSELKNPVEKNDYEKVSICTNSAVPLTQLSKLVSVEKNDGEKVSACPKSAVTLTQSVLPSKPSLSKFVSLPAITVAEDENSELKNIEDKLEKMPSKRPLSKLVSVEKNDGENVSACPKSAVTLTESVPPSKPSLSKFVSLPAITVAEDENSELKNIEDKLEKMVSWITEEDLDSRNKCLVSTLKCKTEMAIIPKDVQNALSKIFSIPQDNSNLDLEKDVNGLYPSNADLGFKTFDQTWITKPDQIFSSIRKQSQPGENNYIYDDYPCIMSLNKDKNMDEYKRSRSENDYKYDDFPCTMSLNKDEKLNESKRSRSDSGVSLDSSFEGSSPEPCDQKLDSEEYSSSDSESEVSQQSFSGMNGKLSESLDNYMKVCYLCKNLILNKFFLICRFGLLLNCSHSFCYSCIRNHCASSRLGSSWVRCPECDEISPGIVSSPRWIEDMGEKTAWFLKYDQETEFFREKQQVF